MIAIFGVNSQNCGKIGVKNGGETCKSSILPPRLPQHLEQLESGGPPVCSRRQTI